MKNLITLLAVYALSGFQSGNAVDAEDFDQALLTLSALKINYNEYLESSGIAPQSLSELGIDEHYFKSDLVEHVDIDPQSGAIMLGLAPAFGQNKWVVTIPKIENQRVSRWTCQSTVGQLFTANTDCRANVEYENLTTVVNTNLFDLTLRYVSKVKVNATEAYTSEAVFPRRLDTLGIDQRWLKNAHVDHAIVEPETKSILFSLSEAYGANHWLVMRARMTRSGRVHWTCKTTLPSSMVNTRERCFVAVKNEDLLSVTRP